MAYWLLLGAFLWQISLPDLSIEKIHAPRWDHDHQRTHIQIMVKNRGNASSHPVLMQVKDVDLSLAEVKQITKDKSVWDLIAENNARGANRMEWDSSAYVSSLDYDPDWVITDSLPALSPGERVTIDLFVEGHWVYDANCEIEVVIDPARHQPEEDRNNNREYFFAWG